ncbi:MAG TPA: CHASE3 domain-containing protein [Hansschlegelia sp.]
MIGPLSAAKSARNEILLLILGFAVLVVVGASSVWIAGRNAVFNAQLAQTSELKSHILLTLSVAQNAETGQRGFLLTNDERYLTPYETALAAWEPRIRRLAELVGPTGPQHDRASALAAALKIKMDELAETVALQRAGKFSEAHAVVETDRGRDAMLEVRRIVTEMRAYEDEQFAKRSGDAAWGANLQLAVVIIGLLIAAALAYGAQVIVRRQTRTLKAAQDELSHANAGLEAAVAERTSELTTANDEIQRFAYIVSHDLRAPLVNVMGFTSELDAARRVLKDQIDALIEASPGSVGEEARLAVDEDLPEAIGFIRASTTKMDRLINAILKLSREGRRVVTPESVSIRDVAEQIAATLHQQTQSADAEIVVEPDTPPLVTDRFSIEQIFQNLIENAVKYLDRSRPGRIVVRGRRVGAQVEYMIEDNGRGIDAKDHERVFELFRRAGAQDQPGEGLGLAFVRASVRRLGGVITLTSNPGQGSTFHLTFPAVFRVQSESRAA